MSTRETKKITERHGQQHISRSCQWYFYHQREGMNNERSFVELKTATEYFPVVHPSHASVKQRRSGKNRGLLSRHAGIWILDSFSGEKSPKRRNGQTRRTEKSNLPISEPHSHHGSCLIILSCRNRSIRSMRQPLFRPTVPRVRNAFIHVSICILSLCLLYSRFEDKQVRLNEARFERSILPHTRDQLIPRVRNPPPKIRRSKVWLFIRSM